MILYHFLNERYGIQAIESRRIKVARLDELNDPFEMMAITQSNPEFRVAMQEVIKLMRGDFGFLCFSEGWNNPVQWSHYADRHFGICLGFEVPAAAVKEITYAPRRLIIPDADLENSIRDVPAFGQMLMTKYSHWRYEREWRGVVKLSEAKKVDDLYFQPFSQDYALTKVIVGVRSNLTRAAISKALGSLSGAVGTFKARLAFRSFQVVRQRKESLWI
jgi:hypothetical protein